MFIDVLVLEEGDSSYIGKKGQVKSWRASVRDMGEGQRCQNNFSYQLTDEETDKYKGKLRDKKVRIHVKQITAGFNGEMRLEGHLEMIKPA